MINNIKYIFFFIIIIICFLLDGKIIGLILGIIWLFNKIHFNYENNKKIKTHEERERNNKNNIMRKKMNAKDMEREILLKEINEYKKTEQYQEFLRRNPLFK